MAGYQQTTPFSSDEPRIRRRCIGGQLALAAKTVADLTIWAHCRPCRIACARRAADTPGELSRR
jgi:hypothetical protein